MDIQSLAIPLFKPIEEDTFNHFLGLAPTSVGIFALSPNEEPSISLHLFKTGLLLRDRNKKFYNLQLTYEIKLEVLYLINRDVTSEIVGFSLLSEDNQRMEFYGPDSLQFTKNLGKILNMKGFQEMFKPVRKLGRGNFATVYQAIRITDQQKFAVKAFSKQNSYCSKNGRQNLINQLSLLRSLNVEPHPNVLRLEAVYQSQNSIYVVLEMLEGKTLLETLQDRKGTLLNDKQVRIVMSGLLKGLHHLYKNRVMHRDIKPENIMIRKENMEPVIVDFGLSTNVDLPEYLFFRCGTPGYVAPEIIRLTQSIHLEPTCDVFSLGAIFHILLTGKPLFPGVKYDEVYRANKQFDYNFQAEIYSSIEKTAFHLLKQMLMVDETERITAQTALNHPFFIETLEEEIAFKGESPNLPSTSNSITNSTNQSKQSKEIKKKKKKYFFF